MEFTWSHCVSVYVGGEGWMSGGPEACCIEMFVRVYTWLWDGGQTVQGLPPPPCPVAAVICLHSPLRPFKGLGQPKMSQWSLNKQNVVFFIWRIYMERQVTENVFQLHFFWHSNLQSSAGTHARKFSKSAFLAVLIFCNLCAQKPFTNHSVYRPWLLMSAAERLLLQHKHLYLNCINTLQEINKFIRPSPSVRPDLVQYLLIRSLNTVGSVRHSSQTNNWIT